MNSQQISENIFTYISISCFLFSGLVVYVGSITIFKECAAFINIGRAMEGDLSYFSSFHLNDGTCPQDPVCQTVSRNQFCLNL